MVKKGAGKKKGKRKKKLEEGEENKTILTEVDKTFYELQIADINRKLARLRLLNEELEAKNLELEEKYTRLDEDRADIIANLKRSLHEKQNETVQLQERLEALQEGMIAEEAELQNKIADMEAEYKEMRELLTSEIKLITGKLNALEEFRLHRDELMRKFEEQEKYIEDQEIRHKKQLFEAEKNYVFGKEVIKRGMERRMFYLAEDFQKSSDLQIAATTHRTIRENITLNHEQDKVIASVKTLETENANLKTINRELRLNSKLYTDERNKAINDSNIQRGVFDQLKIEHKKLMKIINDNKTLAQEERIKSVELKESLKREENLKHKLLVLEQNLHATRCEVMNKQSDINECASQMKKLRVILYEATMSIKAALMLDQAPAKRLAHRENLLNTLLTLLLEYKEEVGGVASMETIPSATNIYKRGDLGFVPKVIKDKGSKHLTYHMQTQMGPSFEDMLKAQLKSSLEQIIEIDEESEQSFYLAASSETLISEEVVNEEQLVFGGEESSEDLLPRFFSKKDAKFDRSDIQSGTKSDIRSGTKSFIQSGTKSDIRSGTESNIESEIPTEMESEAESINEEIEIRENLEDG